MRTCPKEGPGRIRDGGVWSDCYFGYFLINYFIKLLYNFLIFLLPFPTLNIINVTILCYNEINY